MDMKKEMIEQKDYSTVYDAYANVLPVRYTKRCGRRLIASDGPETVDSPLGYGKVMMRRDNSDAVKKSLEYDKYATLNNLLINVYGYKDDVLNSVQSEEHCDILLDRYYPSNPDWILDRNGAPDNNGRVMCPRKVSKCYRLMTFGGRNTRRAFFDIDTEKYVYNKYTGESIKKAYRADGSELPGLNYAELQN